MQSSNLLSVIFVYLSNLTDLHSAAMYNMANSSKNTGQWLLMKAIILVEPGRVLWQYLIHSFSVVCKLLKQMGFPFFFFAWQDPF